MGETVSREASGATTALPDESTPPSSLRLLDAAQRGNVEMVTKWLKKGKKVNKRDERGDTALHKAAQFGHLEVVLLLLRKGADLFAENEDACTPFTTAVLYGQMDCARALLDEQPRQLFSSFRNSFVEFDFSLQQRSGRFAWTLNNFSKIEEKKVYSEMFWIGSTRWRLVVYPRGSRSDDHLSVYVEAIPPILIGNSPQATMAFAPPDLNDSNPVIVAPAEWSCIASFSFAIVNQLTSDRAVYREVTAHRFDRRHTDLGFPHIARKPVLQDKKSGLVHRDRLTIEFCAHVIETSPAAYPNASRTGTFTWRAGPLQNLNLEPQSQQTAPPDQQIQQKERLISPIHKIGGAAWALVLYPRGKLHPSTPAAEINNGTSGSSSFVSVYLRLVPQDGASTAVEWYYLVNFKVSLLNQVDGSHFARQVEHKVFRKGAEDWGFPLFIKQSRVYSSESPFLLEGTLSLQVQIDVIDSHEHKHPSPSALAHLSHQYLWNPLRWAAYHGHLDGFKEILARISSFPPVADTETASNTVHSIAAYLNQPDSRGRTALHFAALGGHSALVHLLCANQCTVQCRDQEGYTPLQYAVWNGHVDTAAAILQYDCSTELIFPNVAAPELEECSSLPLSVFHLAVRQSWHQPALFGLLLRSVPRISLATWLNDRDPEGRTVLHCICAQGFVLLLEHLLCKLLAGESSISALLEAVDHEGYTPLHRAIQRAHLTSARLLLVFGGADPRNTTKHSPMRSALLLAAQQNDMKMVQLLLEDSLQVHDSYDGHASVSSIYVANSEGMVARDGDDSVAYSPPLSPTSDSDPKRLRRSNSSIAEGPFDRFANRHSRIVSRVASVPQHPTTSGSRRNIVIPSPRSISPPPHQEDNTRPVGRLSDADDVAAEPQRRRSSGGAQADKMISFTETNLSNRSRSKSGSDSSNDVLSKRDVPPQAPPEPVDSSNDSNNLNQQLAMEESDVNRTSQPSASAPNPVRSLALKRNGYAETEGDYGTLSSTSPISPKKGAAEEVHHAHSLRKRARSKSSAMPFSSVISASSFRKRKSGGNVGETAKLASASSSSFSPPSTPTHPPFAFQNVPFPAHLDLSMLPSRRVAVDLVEMLRDVDEAGTNCLHMSVLHSNYPLVNYLISRGALLNSVNSEGHSPLDLAIISSDALIALLLLENGAKLMSDKVAPQLFGLISQFTTVAPVTFSRETTNSLGQDMRTLVNNPTFSDIVLVAADGNRISAWKGILCARSVFFRAMFLSPLRESAESIVELNDVSHEILLRVIEFIYTDELNVQQLTTEMAILLLSSANRYILERLKFLTEAWLLDRVADENVYSLFLAADLYEAPTLKAHCVHYIASNADRIIDLPDALNNPSFATCIIGMLKRSIASRVLNDLPTTRRPSVESEQR